VNQHSKKGAVAPPDVIYIIRHGEKPADPPAPDHGHDHGPGHGQSQAAPAAPFGIDFQGNQNAHSLLPRGWQRSGALVALFDPAIGTSEAGLQTPDALLSPSCGDPGKTVAHRTYQTIEGLSDRLGIQIASAFAEGQEPQLAASVVSDYSGVVLICWEHDHIPALASALPTVNETAIPQAWPGDRFDVIWTFTLVPGAATTQYAFGQIPQQLLSGDTDTVITG
jgi:hypothetical protein